MRQIILDVETTGLEPAEGHRIIEIGCIELQNRRITTAQFHHYLWPDREIEPGALEVHGITLEFLQNSPRFKDIVDDFIEFIRGAELIIHNAPFDVGFINHEFALLKATWGKLEEYCSILDTLPLARDMFPGQRNSLDALCKRFEIDNSHRKLHGALLDAEILADVYLAMTGGQTVLALETPRFTENHQHLSFTTATPTNKASRIILPTKEELEAHQQWLEILDKKSGGQCLWKKLDDSNLSHTPTSNSPR